MSEDCGWKPGSPRSDHGLAIGIAQWHLCYRYGSWLQANKLAVVTSAGCRYLRPTVEIREQFFADHPDMRTHFGQFRKYLQDMTACLSGDNRFNVEDDIYTCIRLWNWNAGNAYFLSIERGSTSIPASL